MTDYPAVRRGTSSWKKHENKRKWQSFLAVFITLLLTFAILNGFLKGFSLKKYVSNGKWNGNSSFVTLISTSPPSVLVYQKDQERLAVFGLSEETYLANGREGKPLVKVGELASSRSWEDFARVSSIAFGASINNFIDVKGDEELTGENVAKFVKNFASPLTPVLILLGQSVPNFENTNIVRIDLIRLWWQLKDISIDRIEIADLSLAHEEILGAGRLKVLGVDEASMHTKISPYLENRGLSEQATVEVKNSSGNSAAGELARDFVDSIGFEIASFETSSEIAQETKIESTHKNEATNYLKNVFEGELIDGPKLPDDSGKITIVVGRDFALRYFQ